MSLPAQNPAQQVVATAGQTVFPFSWRADSSPLVVVWVNDNQVGGPTIILNADQTASPGGTITLAVAANAGDIVTVERVNAQTQTLNLSAYYPFTAISLTAALDRFIEMVQEVWAKLAKVPLVKRSMLAKVSSFELPLPQANGSAIGWQTDDGGAHYYLANIIVATGVTGIINASTLVKNEVPVGAVNGTTGNDGNAAFTFAHVPFSTALLDVLVDGVRQPPIRYARVGAIVTFQPGFIPIAGSDVRGDYFY